MGRQKIPATGLSTLRSNSWASAPGTASADARAGAYSRAAFRRPRMMKRLEIPDSEIKEVVSEKTETSHTEWNPKLWKPKHMQPEYGKQKQKTKIKLSITSFSANLAWLCHRMGLVTKVGWPADADDARRTINPCFTGAP